MQVGFIGIILQDIHEDVEMIFLSYSCGNLARCFHPFNDFPFIIPTCHRDVYVKPTECFP